MAHDESEPAGPRIALTWPGKQVAPPIDPRPVLVHREAYDPPAHDLPFDALPEPWRNQLVRGDNRRVAAALQPACQGQVALIYLDPPFFVGSDFRLRRAGGGPAPVAYSDRWQGGLAEYLQMLYDRLPLVRELLAPDGSLFVHVDQRTQAHVRLLCDEIFGEGALVNELIWSYSTSGRPADSFPRKHDTLFWYRRGPQHRFYPDQVRVPYSAEYLRTHFTATDDAGQPVRKRFDAGRWRVYRPEQGMVPNSVWTIPYVNSQAKDRTAYPTQKPLELLERIVNAVTQPGDLVADLCCGSGTTLVAAQRLGRRWLGCDVGALAIQTATQRLLGGERAFDVYDLGEPPSGGEVTVAAQVRPSGRGLHAVELLAPAAAEVALWAVDWAPAADGVFRYQWHAARSRRRPLASPLVTAPRRFAPGEHEFAIKVVTVDGAEGVGRVRLTVG